ncbi:hypothetical protein HPB47_018968 [Ixodes persulcatus]|uniref:Uncharacterized protein n=1 Tax=Ixodes persulcatus TaxID=34615 RepID=A0AC60R244_IXOPE|nr:hypothetical protein HPB47_018968 [Ixodes persulcatus]
MGKCRTQKTRKRKFAGNRYTTTRLPTDTDAGISATAKKLGDITKAYKAPLENSTLQGNRIMDIEIVLIAGSNADTNFPLTDSTARVKPATPLIAFQTATSKAASTMAQKSAAVAAKLHWFRLPLSCQLLRSMSKDFSDSEGVAGSERHRGHLHWSPVTSRPPPTIIEPSAPRAPCRSNGGAPRKRQVF